MTETGGLYEADELPVKAPAVKCFSTRWEHAGVWHLAYATEKGHNSVNSSQEAYPRRNVNEADGW